MHRLILFITLVILSISPSFSENEKFFKNLSKSEIDKIFAKEIILKTVKVKDAPWPLIKIFGVISATPLEAISVYAAYDQQKVYVPKIIISKPIKQVNPTNIHVEYERYMPWPLSNIKYTTGNIIKKIENGGYKLSWYKVKSESTKDTRGSITFLPYKDVTLIEYHNFVHPDSFFATLLKDTMLKDVKTTLVAIIDYIEKVKENSKKMDNFKKRVNQALTGKFVY